MGVKYFSEYSTIHDYEPISVFLNMKWLEIESNVVKWKSSSKMGTLFIVFNLVTKLVLEYEFHFSLKYSAIKQYDSK
jgi:hypothetical protein